MTTIYLIRHGENDWVGRRLPGRTPGLPLNDRGRAQALAVAEAFRPIRLEAVYASPLERAVETAEPLANAQGLRLQRRPGLAEMDVGSWQGQPLSRLRRRKVWPVIQTAPSQARFPGGESFVEAQARVAVELETLAGAHSGRRAAFACVSHADIIKLAVAHAIGLPLDLFQRLAIQPASITVLLWHRGRPMLAGLNDTHAAERIESG